MSSFTEDNCFNYTVLEQSKKSLVFVKLTDSALQAIEEYIENQDSSKPTIQFENSRGLLSLSQNGETKQFSFSLSNIANNGSFKCMQQEETGSFECVGSMEMKMLINANEDSYANTKNKMAAVLQKQNCTKEMNTARSRSSWKANVQHKKLVSAVPVVSATPSVLKKPLPLKPNLPKPNSDIVNKPIRDRLIHILATKPYKKPELLVRLNREGLSVEDKNRLLTELDQVAVFKKNEYHLADKMWGKVQDKWKYYSPEAAALVQKKKQSYLQKEKSPPLNNQPSKPSIHANLTRRELPDIYPSIKKKISNFTQISNNDFIHDVLPTNKPPKLSRGSETKVKNFICPESTKLKQHRNRKSNSKCHDKMSFNKSTTPMNKMKNGNASSAVQFVKSSSPDHMHDLQSISASSSKLEEKRDDANTVSSFIANPALKNSNSSKPSSSEFILNNSRELLLKSNGLGCKRKEVNQLKYNDFKRKKQSCLQNCKNPPFNNHPSNPPANASLTEKGSLDIYPPINKKISDFIQISRDDVIPGDLPMNKLSSESEVTNFNSPAESTKPKQHKNRKRKSKQHGKMSSNKSTSSEDEVKNGNQSSAVQSLDKLIKNKKVGNQDIRLPFVESSSLNFQGVPVSSSTLKQKGEETNTVSSFITNPALNINNSPAKPSSELVVNSSSKLLLKLDGLECKGKAAHQVPSASFKPVDKADDIVQTSLPVINSNSELKKQYSGQVLALLNSYRKSRQPHNKFQSSSSFNNNSFIAQFFGK